MARSSTTFPCKWTSGKTTVIRVPARLSDDLLDIARLVDQWGGFRVREESKGLFLEMIPTRSVHYKADRPINVASVPHRSPFRYPGGKTWFVPYARLWLSRSQRKPKEFVEPFAGGAIIGLTAVFEGLVDRTTLVELDVDVCAVWQTILGTEGEKLARKILDFTPTPRT